jgi:hypothetical protein
MHDWHGKEIGVLNPRDGSPATLPQAREGESITWGGRHWSGGDVEVAVQGAELEVRSGNAAGLRFEEQASR